MPYVHLTLEDKKVILKRRAINAFFRVLESAIFWLIFGFLLGSLLTGYEVTSAISQIDKIMVCK